MEFLALAGGIAIGIALAIIVAKNLRAAARRDRRQGERRLALALQSSGLAMFDWDVPSGRVRLGAQWGAMLGGEAAETVTWIDELERLVHPDDLPALRERLRQLLEGETSSYRVEHRVRRRGGAWLWIESAAEVTERDASGRAVRVTGTNGDISARKALGEMKDAFVAAVSHELRTPLAGIIASLELLKEGSAGELSEDGRRFVEMAIANAERLNELVNDVLDLERADSGRLRLELETLEVAALLREAASLNASYVERCNAKLRIDAAPGLNVRGDRKALLHVIANLVSNAAKFSPEEGEILLAASRAAADRVLLSVADQGPGVPEDFKARLFERFEQADHDKGGTGLGLAICKTLIERMGGRIWCESVPGRGATFFAELPADQ